MNELLALIEETRTELIYDYRRCDEEMRKEISSNILLLDILLYDSNEITKKHFSGKESLLFQISSLEKEISNYMEGIVSYEDINMLIMKCKVVLGKAKEYISK